MASSTLQLPPGPWTSVLDCLCDHFATVSREQWLDRIARGRVLDEHGEPIDQHHLHRTGLTIRYFREVADEAPIPFDERLVHVDADLVVADKPHFLPVTPAGGYVEETLLNRLVRKLGNPDLVPLHRIDRGTAGLVMFSANRASRSLYQTLFRDRAIAKEYEALAPALPDLEFPLTRRTRIVAGDPFFRMREIEGPANSETRIAVIERKDASWHYALSPVTGRKHQLRVHMAAIGAAIVNDGFYPDLSEETPDDYTRPLKLLAKTLAFADPLSGEARRFESLLTL
jgi:tRNA pseudouridine32 synthase/23S rRNA pseudouridine746 synthase